MTTKVVLALEGNYHPLEYWDLLAC